MSDHNLDLAKKRIDDAVKKGTADLSAKKTELQTLEANIKTWEQNAKLGKEKVQELIKQTHTLETVMHAKIEEEERMVREHQQDLAKTSKQAVDPKNRIPPHTFL